MEQEYVFFKMDLFIRESGKIINLMDKAYFIRDKEKYLNVSLIMDPQQVQEKEMDLEKTKEKSKFYTLMDLFMMDNGLIIKDMAKELKYIKMEINIMMDFGQTIKDKEEESLLFMIKITKNKLRDIFMEIFIMIKLKDL